MRWKLYERLRQVYDDVSLTYGYITKHTRIAHGLQKTHMVDARCISKNPDATPPEEVFLMRKVRCHNRQLHKMTVGKGGRRKRNQAPRYVQGVQLFDKVEFEGVECFVFGRRMRGYFDVRTLDGRRISAGVSYKKLTLLEKRRSVLVERRSAVSPRA